MSYSLHFSIIDLDKLILSCFGVFFAPFLLVLHQKSITKGKKLLRDL